MAYLGQQPRRVPDTNDGHVGGSQPLCQVVHCYVGGGARQDPAASTHLLQQGHSRGALDAMFCTHSPRPSRALASTPDLSAETLVPSLGGAQRAEAALEGIPRHLHDGFHHRGRLARARWAMNEGQVGAGERGMHSLLLRLVQPRTGPPDGGEGRGGPRRAPTEAHVDDGGAPMLRGRGQRLRASWTGVMDGRGGVRRLRGRGFRPRQHWLGAAPAEPVATGCQPPYPSPHFQGGLHAGVGDGVGQLLEPQGHVQPVLGEVIHWSRTVGGLEAERQHLPSMALACSWELVSHFAQAHLLDLPSGHAE